MSCPVYVGFNVPLLFLSALAPQDKYCSRQAELGVGDCGGLRVRTPP